jgi:hypothetical protein
MHRIQLLAIGTISFTNALICKIQWEAHPNVMLVLLCWFFAITSLTALWKLINEMEKK